MEPMIAKHTATAIAGAFVLATLLSACSPAAVTPASVTVTASPTTDRQEAVAAPTPPPASFTFVAAGDVLPHAPVVSSATNAGVIDFSPLTASVMPYIAGADLAICHMEVPVAPPGTAPSGYPMFGSPSQLVPDLAEDGWDGCTTASNHSVDRGAAGIAATLEAFAAVGLGAVGTARTEAEAAQAQLYVVSTASGDITVANISFAYGLNGLPKPSGQPWAVNTFNADAADAAPIIDAARAAREAGADVVIASVHCCVEYQTEPTPAQRSVAQQIATSGQVDLYVGHHAHVPQPIELLPGGPTGEGMWTAFGLGNYLSNQDAGCCTAQSNNGVLLTSTFTQRDDGLFDVAVEWTATTVEIGARHTMHVLSDLGEAYGGLTAAQVSQRHTLVAEAVGPAAPERSEPAKALARGVAVVTRTQ